MSVATIEPPHVSPAESTFIDHAIPSRLSLNKPKILYGLMLTAGAFIVFTGLVPFDPTAADPIPGPRPFLSLLTSRTTHWDFSANIFLYTPFGLLLHLWFKSRLKHAFLPAIGTFLIGSILSLSIEVAQAFIVPRVSSLLDVFANSMGLIAGIALSTFTSTLVPRIGAEALREACHQPAETLLKSYCAALFILATIPFVFSLDPVRLAKKIRAGHWTPFVDLKSEGPAPDAANTLNIEPPQVRADHLRRWSRWAGEALSFAILAMLIPPAIRERFRLSFISTLFFGGWITLAMAVGLFILQIPTVARHIDVTDVVVRIAAAIPILVLTVSATCATPRPALSNAPAWPSPRLTTAGLLAATVYILWMGLIPFTLDRDGTIHGVLRAENLIPFYSTFQAKLDSTVDDMTGKVFSYALFAGLLALQCAKRETSRLRFSTLSICALCALLSTVIEIAQIFLPTRAPSITDVLYAIVGGRLGILAHDGLLFASHIIERARLTAMAQPLSGGVDPLTWANEIMASLADPHPDAPRERAPQPSEQKLSR